MLLPGLILRAEGVPQAFLPVSGSAELQRIVDAEVRAAAELALGRPRSAIRTVTTGLKLAMDLVHVDHPSSDVEKGIGYAAMIRMTEHAALANAAAGKYDKAEPLIAAVINKRQELRGRDDAANFSAIVAWSNKYAIDAQMDVPAMVLPRLLDLFADLGTSPWGTEMYSLGVLATNLGACLFLMQPTSLADIELAARRAAVGHGIENLPLARMKGHQHQRIGSECGAQAHRPLGQIIAADPLGEGGVIEGRAGLRRGGGQQRHAMGRRGRAHACEGVARGEARHGEDGGQMHDARNDEAAQDPGQGREGGGADPFPPLHRQASRTMVGMARSVTEKALALSAVS